MLRFHKGSPGLVGVSELAVMGFDARGDVLGGALEPLVMAVFFLVG